MNSSLALRPRLRATTPHARHLGIPIRGVVPGLRIPALPSGERLNLQTADGLLGGEVWPSAVALCNHLAQRSRWLSESNPLTAELGAGTGAVGLYAAGLGARAVLTDVGPMTATGYGGTVRLLHLMRENARANCALCLHFTRS